MKKISIIFCWIFIIQPYFSHANDEISPFFSQMVAPNSLASSPEAYMELLLAHLAKTHNWATDLKTGERIATVIRIPMANVYQEFSLSLMEIAMSKHWVSPSGDKYDLSSATLDLPIYQFGQPDPSRTASLIDSLYAETGSRDITPCESYLFLTGNSSLPQPRLALLTK